MSRAPLRTHMIVPLLALVACSTGEPEPQRVTEWRGPELHGEIRGEVQGERVDIVAEADEVACKREYEVADPGDPATWGDGHLKEIEISLLVIVDGVERRYELEFFNFTDLAVGAELDVVPVVVEDAPIGAGEVHVEVQWEWEIGSDFVVFEELATSGVLEIHELSGTVGADGLVIPANDGNVGGFIDVELPSGSVAISFTAPCTVVEVETMTE